MKMFYVAAFLLFALLLSACERQNTAQNASNNSANQSAETKKMDSGLITLESQNNFDETYSRLKKPSKKKKH